MLSESFQESSYNLMHLQNPSLLSIVFLEGVLGGKPDNSLEFVVGFVLETYSDSFAALPPSHFRCLLARRTTLTIVLGYFATPTYLL